MTATTSIAHPDFLLQSETARRIYHDIAESMPIFDYHCHLSPQDIAENRSWPNLAALWLEGDHYKWRAMRADGVPERLITGDADPFDKFKAWSRTVPHTLRNPLYHWTHLELKRPFGITDRYLGVDTAEAIWKKSLEMLAAEGFRARNLLENWDVRVVCTTDDPADTLEHHAAIARDSTCSTRVLPTFRPDKAMAVEDPAAYGLWLERLEAVSGVAIITYDDLLRALRNRHDKFHSAGCRLSDHGLERPYAEDYSEAEIRRAFDVARAGRRPNSAEADKLKSALMHEFAVMDAEKGWTQQLHIGPIRNNNSRMFHQLGPDAGFDSIGDAELARPLSRFLDRLDQRERLPKTILYNINPKDNAVLATMTGNFQDASTPGKMQFGAAWWHLDQKAGMEQQLNDLSNMGLLSRFVGMLTDSRSFLSYSRHEYFRRILCNLLGEEMERGELPADLTLLGELVQDICFRNARRYFELGPSGPETASASPSRTISGFSGAAAPRAPRSAEG